MNNKENIKEKKIVVNLILLFAVIVFVGAFIYANNKLSRDYQAVKAQQGQVETVIQRRSDLIPNLVSATKGDMKHEDKVYGEIARARAELNSADTPQDKFVANNRLDKSVHVLFSDIHENYPGLASHQDVRDLMIEIEGSENRIATERQNYNAAAGQYNTDISTFPGGLVKGSRKPVQYFRADKAAQKAPQVKF